MIRRCDLRPSQYTVLGVRLVAFFVLVALAVCGLGLALAACDTGVMWFRYADAGADQDAGTDAGAEASDKCPDGGCLLKPDQEWHGPEWMRFGPNQDPDGENGVPPCPLGPPTMPIWHG